MTSEHGREEHRRSASEKQASEAGNVDVRHFALYAFSGRTGALRWSRKNENIQAQPTDASAMIPQHNYKLDVHALNSRHPGESMNAGNSENQFLASCLTIGIGERILSYNLHISGSIKGKN
uniref:Uncharacterized protein n=1 Tax=Aegilops tauschii subsp. strangulata TaxID=200361 RepID=A0A453MNN9_AEGTS